MNNATIYCLCLNNKVLNLVKNLGYIPVGLGNESFSTEWTRDNTLKNISFKNKYYGEYTFHYWFWKNLLPKVNDNHWVGFCAHKDFWCAKKEIQNDPVFKINKEKVPSAILKNKSNLKDLVISEIPAEWEKYDTVIGDHHYINNIKFTKLIKRGLYSMVRNPSALLKSKRNIRFHFDMWHGNGNLDRAIELLGDSDRDDFKRYTNENVSFSRGNMFVCRSKKIINNFYNSIFPWLENCEKIFGFNLNGYGKTRIYAFLAERYMSYWFEKYTKPLLWPVIFYDINK